LSHCHLEREEVSKLLKDHKFQLKKMPNSSNFYAAGLANFRSPFSARLKKIAVQLNAKEKLKILPAELKLQANPLALTLEHPLSFTFLFFFVSLNTETREKGNKISCLGRKNLNLSTCLLHILFDFGILRFLRTSTFFLVANFV